MKKHKRIKREKKSSTDNRFALKSIITKFHSRLYNDSNISFQMIFDNSLDAILIIAPDGRIIMANSAACEMFGRTEKEIRQIGRNGIIDTTDPRFASALQEKERTGRYKGELACLHADGTKFPVELTSAVFNDNNGNPCTVMVIRDITKRIQSEEKIKKVNRLYAVLSEINEAIVRIDNQEKLLKEACRIAVETGGFRLCWIGVIEPGSVRVIPVADYGLSDDYLDMMKMSISPDVKEGRGPTGIAFREGRYSICNDIENDEMMLSWRESALEREYRSSASFPLIRSGEVYGVINFYSSQAGFFDKEEIKLLQELSSDISYSIESIEREKQRQKIEEERDRLFYYSIDMMSIAGFDGYFKQLNPSWEKTLGWTNEELMAKPNIEFVHPEDRKSTLEAAEDIVFRKEIKIHFLNRYQCSDGSYKWLSWNAVPLNKENLIFSVTRDVTELLKNEEQRKNLEAQLIQAQKLESLGTLAGGIAHDFNNILNIIMGYATLLQSRELNTDELSGSIETIMEASKRGADLIKQLLTFARKSETVFQSVQINDIIIEVRKLLRQTFPKTIEIIADLQADLPIIIADANQIHQVLLNLCVNARDAMQNGGSLSIFTRSMYGNLLNQHKPAESGRYIEIQVRDTGTGMEDSVKQKIFEPFFTTKEKGKGTGLGLALVYSIIKNHSGNIEVSSEPGKGTTVHIYFPVSETTTEIHQFHPKSIEEIPEGRGTILLIEDEKMLSEMLTTILVLKGYKVISANDGLQGIMAFQKYKEDIAVVITDLGLPQIGGEEVYKHIKAMDQGAKVILVSGNMDPETKARLFNAGARHFIQKPYMPDKILKIIKNVIEEAI